MTIRQIYELLKADGEEFLDAELTINVRGNQVVRPLGISACTFQPSNRRESNRVHGCLLG